MDDILDRVAMAIRNARLEDQDSWGQARAAIESMREPTRAMRDAAATVDRYAEPGEEWGPMIDALLAGEHIPADGSE